MPYSKLPPVPSFPVASPDLAPGGPVAAAQHSAVFQIPGGQDVSPALTWTGLPAGTRSIAVTMYDPDAPTPSGFWHWALADLPGDLDGIPAGIGAPDADLPGAAFHLPMEAGLRQYVGSAPPPGTGVHRYIFAVHALDVDSVRSLGVSEQSSPAVLHFLIRENTLGRGLLEGWSSAEEWQKFAG